MAIINPLPSVFQNGTTADASQVDANFAQVVANVNSNAAPATSAYLVPSGAIMAFYLASPPTGWLACDGTNGTPDLRGYFVRGLDTSGLIDPGRVLGSVEQDQFQNHVHTLADGGTAPGGAGTGMLANSGFGTLTTSLPTTGNHGLETRPKNVALLYCMKQ